METGSSSEICQICEYQDIEKPATSYCADCDEPELMCELCALQHPLPKATRNHTIIGDISTFSNHIKTKAQAKDGKDSPLRDIPGKPKAIEVRADTVTLSWKKPEDFYEHDRYQIRYKEIKADRWTTDPAEIANEIATLMDLKADTEFVFKVRTLHMDSEGKYSSTSEGIRTPKTPASQLLNFAIKKENDSPSKYTVPMEEMLPSRDENAKCRKLYIGKDGIKNAPEKTIMLVGATGTGKSTLVDGIVNYVLGVNWDDPFRFTAIDLEQEELAKKHNEAVSQTEWITCYSIDPYKGSRLDYRLTIIDTPGFGDTRGIERDIEIVEQIRQLFSAKDIKGVSFIDAVCFLIKAPDARLTATQRYIFHAIMSLFGNDIKDNICTLVTFADGETPPVLASLSEANLPFGRHFKFNNSALFTANLKTNSSSLSHLFWKMGCESYGMFFQHLTTLETKSLQLTKQVLDERNTLEITIQNLQPQVKLGLSKIAEIEKTRTLFETHASAIKRNAKFTYQIETVVASKRNLPPGRFTTACLQCHTTCHELCGIQSDQEKARCIAMDRTSGNCMFCKNKCHWSKHSNIPFIHDIKTVVETKTYEDMKRKYEEATGEKMNHERLLLEMRSDLRQLENHIEVAITVMKQCNEQLNNIALHPNPLSMVEHIDMMIEAEKLEKKSGFKDRVKALNEIRHKAQIGDHAEQLVKEANKAIHSITITTKKASTDSFFTKIKDFVTGR